MALRALLFVHYSLNQNHLIHSDITSNFGIRVKIIEISSEFGGYSV